jgi:hypothetical protein
MPFTVTFEQKLTITGTEDAAEMMQRYTRGNPQATALVELWGVCREPGTDAGQPGPATTAALVIAAEKGISAPGVFVEFWLVTTNPFDKRGHTRVYQHPDLTQPSFSSRPADSHAVYRYLTNLVTVTNEKGAQVGGVGAVHRTGACGYGQTEPIVGTGAGRGNGGGGWNVAAASTTLSAPDARTDHLRNTPHDSNGADMSLTDIEDMLEDVDANVDADINYGMEGHLTSLLSGVKSAVADDRWQCVFAAAEKVGKGRAAIDAVFATVGKGFILDRHAATLQSEKVLLYNMLKQDILPALHSQHQQQQQQHKEPLHGLAPLMQHQQYQQHQQHARLTAANLGRRGTSARAESDAGSEYGGSISGGQIFG